MAIVIPPSLIAGAKTAGAVALEIVPIAAVAAGLTGLFKVFEKKPTAWEKTVKVAEQVATVGGVVKVGFEIFDGIYSRMYPKAETLKGDADHEKTSMATIMAAMDNHRERTIDARVKEAVAEAVAAYEARMDAQEAAAAQAEPEPVVLQKPTTGKHVTRRAKTGTGK